VPRGTTVAGVDVGGLDRDDAVARLRERLAAATGPVPVRVGERSARLQASAAGLAFDPVRTVDTVIGPTGSPSTILRSLTGGGPVDPATTTDRARLRTALSALARRLDVPARDGAVTLGASGATARAAVTGTAVDVDAAVATVAEQWLVPGDGVRLPTRSTAPAVGQAEVERALAEVGRPVTSGPLAVAVDGRTVQLSVEQLLPAVSVRAASGRLDLAVDGPALAKAVLARTPGLRAEPRDARIVLSGGRPKIEPGVPGRGIDPAALARDARPALLATGDARKVTAPLTTVQPELTTQEAEALGVVERVSTFSTKYPPNPDRTTNLRIAARTVNGTLVLPGETFSLNKVLGRRTAAKGYKQAPAINAGRLQKDIGGGVSQMATTIFNNVFFAGLQDVEHKAHSFYISRYPEGREATVNYPTVDLKWRNDTDHAVLVAASVTSTVNVSFWSTKVWDRIEAQKGPRTSVRPPKKIYDPRPGCVAQQPSPGFDVVVKRLFYRDGALQRTQSFSTRYIPEDHVICGPDPSAAAVVPKTPARAPAAPVLPTD
jgi:vancomycin resistance protein YoaR